MIKSVISLNPDENISIKADETIFKLYESTLKKNGSLVAYNELKSFTYHFEKELIQALNGIRESEKWFHKGIELIHEYRPYLNKKDKNKRKIEELIKTYPDLRLDSVLEEDPTWAHLPLVSMVHYIDSNSDYFKTVNSIDLLKKAKDLRDAIIYFDFIYLIGNSGQADPPVWRKLTPLDLVVVNDSL